MSSPTLINKTIPENLLREPLEYLFADHVRLHAFCQAIGEVAVELESGPLSAPEQTDNLRAILNYLRDELPRHIADEEIDIIPRLKLRAKPEDHIEQILDQIRHEHSKDESLTDTLIDELDRLAKGVMPENTQGLIHVARHFAETHCRHLRWENDTLLPLARKRLTREDQKQIGRTMARRRGVPFPD